MSKKERNEWKVITSGLTGALAGAFVGWYLSNLVNSVLIINDLVVTIAMSILFGCIGLLLDIKKPILAETIVFAVTILVLFQATWDVIVGDWSSSRNIIVMIAVGLFILNLFTGFLRVGTAKKIIRGQLGMK